VLTASGALAVDGPFGEVLSDFRPRPQQQDIAGAIARTIDTYGTLICEAGTGSGKTFAYLTPALLSGRKVIISTGTRNLQEQLFHRDLPLVQRALGVPVRTALLKGRGNYLCRHRLAVNVADGRVPQEAARDLVRIQAWAGRTARGDIAELGELPEDAPAWRLATSTVDNCLGQQCPSYGECHVLHARRAAIGAELVVVNHHLFLADVALREEGFGELLPSTDAVIFDEAHQLPDLATRFFGRSLGSVQLVELARDVAGAARREAPDTPGLSAAGARLEKAARDMRLAFGLEPGRVGWTQAAVQPRVRAALDALHAALEELAESLASVAERGADLQGCSRRSRDLQARLELVSAPADDAQVRWVELRPRSFTWQASPLEVSEVFASRLSAHRCAWIFTSATLAVNGSFEHFAARIGLVERDERLWPSPFDYATQALCCVPEGMPDPHQAAYDGAVCEVAAQVLEASRGRAFILFTSHRALEACAQRLPGRTSYPLLVQGSATRGELLRRFRTTPHAVLLGTASFWEGVDVRGEALSCVIIDKLPFAAPGDPILEARLAAMRARGQDPFRHYQLPQAVIALKQGAGRLIRDVGDRGVLVLCDPRVYTRAYGRVFLDSLPTMRRTRRLEDVERFFAADGDRGA
jgi:ATP-dependent DNA helicase DinG